MTRGRGGGPWLLTLRRCGVFWRDSVRSWRLTLDWTVLLYIALPVLWIAGGIYTDWLRHPPDWVARLPERTVPALLALLMLRARLRTFADPGDALFMRTSRRWVAAMTRFGLLYTLAARLAIAAAVSGLLLPLLSSAQAWTPGAGACLAAAAGLAGFVWTLARDMAERRWRGWRRLLALYALRLGALAVWLPASMLFAPGASPAAAWSVFVPLAAVAAALAVRRTAVRGAFEQELAAERQAYADNVGWVLSDLPKPPKPPSAKRPFLLRKPGPLLRNRSAEARIAELWLKSAVRDGDMMKTVLYFAVLGVVAVWLTPLWLAVAVWIALGALLLWWLNSQWRQWFSARYMTLFDWAHCKKGDAVAIGRLRLVQPIGLLWSLVTGLHAGLMNGGGWQWALVLVLPAACYALLGWLNGSRLLAYAERPQKSADAGPDKDAT